MGEEPRDIQERIEQTREQMGDTVEALAYKADVPGRVKGAVGEKKDAAIGKIAGVKDAIAGGASSAAEATGGAASQASDTATRGVGMAQENPLGLAIGAVAAGFVVGMLIPSTRVEDERLGPVADTVKEQARDVGSEAVELATQVAQDVAQAATQTAMEAGQHHVDELRESVTSTSSSADAV
jgi:hypothetical protein